MFLAMFKNWTEYVAVHWWKWRRLSQVGCSWLYYQAGLQKLCPAWLSPAVWTQWKDRCYRLPPPHTPGYSQGGSGESGNSQAMPWLIMINLKVYKMLKWNVRVTCSCCFFCPINSAKPINCHKLQRKAGNSYNEWAGTRKCLTFLLERKWHD